MGGPAKGIPPLYLLAKIGVVSSMNYSILGWVANILLLTGTWLVGSKKILLGLYFSFFGTIAWLIRAFQLNESDLIFINVAFLFLTARAIYNWSKTSCE